MTDQQWDAVIIGGGHNGLVCATYLAKAGNKVLVLEANDVIGGASATRPFAEGFSVSACAHWLTQLNPQVSDDLRLERHGLELAARDLNTIALDPAGNHITITGPDIEGADLSEQDKVAYHRFHQQTLKFAKLLATAFKRRAPKLVENNLTDRLTLVQLGLGMKMLGKADMSDLLRIALINMYDVMEENFDNELLKAALSLDGVLGSHMGPRSPNTVFGYLYRRVGDIYGFNGPAVVKGGMGGVGKALANAATAAGVEIRTGARVDTINLDASRASGVTLSSGEVIQAARVVSNADPKTTFNELVGRTNIETGTVRRVHNIRMQGNAAKLHLALDGLPEFSGVSAGDSGHRLVIAPTMNYIEKAFNHAKYGEFSEAPAIDISIPTVHDSSLAPAGKHVLSVIVQFAPYDLKQGWNAETKQQFEQLVIDRIAEYAPQLKELIIASELLTPQDLASEFNMSGGHWHHGEISLDQIMMMRPFPGATQYATDIEGLFLCGAGAHPGGGVMGLAGRNAAKEMIKRGKPA
ncbi:phytoene desaturase family protein [Oceanicoccus sagamiensis]|uniref:Pyridine nucleotide-disulfide oxidoreductase domain-containing protein 2 n=1 Tax=Oceanicoccus sagamiensis TaxID=716816 RepID=A0A1X9NJC5_9GAMM|nr:NAD(P)/FAD-dependent oxidoreductase [Oceanicoccus sagamiensis]ARN75955.1 phytoene dehydrogenase [Oceanicoccus sagamiensis]